MDLPSGTRVLCVFADGAARRERFRKGLITQTACAPRSAVETIDLDAISQWRRRRTGLIKTLMICSSVNLPLAHVCRNQVGCIGQPSWPVRERHEVLGDGVAATTSDLLITAASYGGKFPTHRGALGDSSAKRGGSRMSHISDLRSLRRREWSPLALIFAVWSLLPATMFVLQLLGFDFGFAVRRLEGSSRTGSTCLRMPAGLIPLRCFGRGTIAKCCRLGGIWRHAHSFCPFLRRR